MSVILTQKEKERRKAIWDTMTPEEQQEAENKKNEIIDWYGEQEKEVYKKLEEEGRLHGGLDGHYPEVVKLNEEYRHRLHNLLVSLFGEEPL